MITKNRFTVSPLSIGRGKDGAPHHTLYIVQRGDSPVAVYRDEVEARDRARLEEFKAKLRALGYSEAMKRYRVSRQTVYTWLTAPRMPREYRRKF